MMDALLNKGYDRVMAILPRRAGKDLTAFNICIRMLIRKVQTIYYVFPTFNDGRNILWDALTNDGFRVLDYLPSELVESRNEQMMRIKLKNGSVFQVMGSNKPDKMVGTNPSGIVFSEYAKCDERVYQFAGPILNGNGGWALFISTPRGKNHFWDLWNISQSYPDKWFGYRMTIEETGHIPVAVIRGDVERGEISEDMAQQEYFCSFELGVEGSYYAKYIDRMHLQEQIGKVLWDPNNKVHTAWDIGYNDATAIIFFQVSSTNNVHIIDYHEKSKEEASYHAKIVLDKPYQYGLHIGPHDVWAHNSTGDFRWKKYNDLGITMTRDHNQGEHPETIDSGIEAVKTVLSKCYIDEVKCKSLIKSLENYRQEKNSKKETYGRPVHDKHSHGADAMRYLAVGMKRTVPGKSAEDLRQLHAEARYGASNNKLPPIFNSNNPMTPNPFFQQR
jgi:phage terminase large subunit